MIMAAFAMLSRLRDVLPHPRTGCFLCSWRLPLESGNTLVPFLSHSRLYTPASSIATLALSCSEAPTFHLQAKKPIPGGNSITSGWSLEQYHALVKQVMLPATWLLFRCAEWHTWRESCRAQVQGNSVVIVGTAEERLIVPLLRKALLLDS
jgi:hypothetical protein